MKVLIIDSSVLILNRLEEMLLTARTATAICSSVSYENGLQIFNESKPDLVLLGISLPESRSIKLLGEIKAAVYNMPVIILYINMNEYIHEQCRLLGADHFLDKYYDFEKITSVIGNIAGPAKSLNDDPAEK